VAVMSPHRAQCSTLASVLLASAFSAPAAPAAAAGSPSSSPPDSRGSSPPAATATAPPAAAATALRPFFRMIDTVEKLQGQEAPVVIYSATASCTSALAANADFYASLHRTNVALSRARRRLVVVVSESMLGFVPGALGCYRDMGLFKRLRGACGELLGSVRVQGHAVRVFGAA